MTQDQLERLDLEEILVKTELLALKGLQVLQVLMVNVVLLVLLELVVSRFDISILIFLLFFLRCIETFQLITRLFKN